MNPIENTAQPESNTGRWSKLEHQHFLEALKLYGKDWKKVQEYVVTRSGSQIRSHSQKFFRKLIKDLKLKNGENSKENENLRVSNIRKNLQLSLFIILVNIKGIDKFFPKMKLTDNQKPNKIPRKNIQKKSNFYNNFAHEYLDLLYLKNRI